MTKRCGVLLTLTALMALGAGGSEAEKEKGTIGKGHFETGKLLSAQFIDIGKIKLGERAAKVLVTEYEKVVLISVDTWETREEKGEFKYPLSCRVLDAKGEELKKVEEGQGEWPRGVVVAHKEYPSPTWFLFLKEGRDLSGGTVEVKTEGEESKLAYPRPAKAEGQ